MSWKIDNAHTQIGFIARHMMISKVRGNFEKFTGTVSLDEANPAKSSVEIQVETASVNTREAQRDGHLRSPDFFDSEKFPYMTFKSKSVNVTGANTARLVGDLTIKDVTHEVVLNVEFLGKAKSPWGTTSAGFSGSAKINRKDWGLTYNAVLETGGFMVSDEIELDINLELVQVAETEPSPTA